MAKTVAVIGAGPAGLVAIKSCLEVGLEPTAFETDPWLGGAWKYTDLADEKHRRSCVAYSTVTNTSKHVSCFSDFPMPNEWPNYLPQQNYLEYFQMYAKEFGLEERIRFEANVLSVEPTSDSKTDQNARWRVRYQDLKQNCDQVETFDFVMVCSGVNNEPRLDIPGLDGFCGDVIHSKEYRTWKNFEGKRVIVVGMGNSAGDIACELSHHTEQVYLSTRSGGWVVSRLLGGDSPGDTKFLTRLVDSIPSTIRGQVFHHKLKKGVNLVNFGLEAAHPPDKRFPLINDELPHRIITGSIKVKAEIAKTKEKTVMFGDGSKVEDIDVIILATGFKFGFPFLCDSLLCPKDRYIPLYRYVFPPFCNPGTIAIIAAVRVNGPIPPIAEIQSRWAVSVFAGKTKLPDCQMMVEEIERRQQLLEASTIECCRAFHMVNFIRYSDEISSLIGARPNLWHLLMTDPVLAFRCFFGPCIPAQYRLVGRGAWPEARDIIMGVRESKLCPLRTRKTGPKEGQDRNSSLSWLFCLVTVLILFLLILSTSKYLMQ